MPSRGPASAARSATDRHVTAGALAVTLRVLEHGEEFRACVELQESTWGRDGETVPSSLMAVATHVGGLALGAFDARGTLVGLVFGLAGVDARGALHWSHMLAVRAGARGAGIGRALKERQRAELSKRGVNRIAWTFDPLQARNAHLNVNRLGARVVEYIDDLYGVTTSPLHLGVATDRLVVMTDSDVLPLPHPAIDSTEGLPVLTLPELGGVPLSENMPATLLVEVPWDIEEVVSLNGGTHASHWRLTTRRHFHFCLTRGYQVSAFVRDEPAHRAFYCFTL